jgi:hypothetical protein
VVLYEMAAGRRPFAGETRFELASAILSQPPRALPAGVPLALSAIIERCLAKEPAQRYQRAGEVRSTLEALQAGSAPAAWPGWRSALVAHRWPAALAVLLSILAAAAGLDLRPGPRGTRVGLGRPPAAGLATPREAGPKAQAAALQAIALDERSAEAHEALAVVRTWTDWDWAGDYDATIDWLERAFEVRAPGLPSIGCQPYFDPLRSDPRFQHLLRRLGLPQR